MDIHSVHVLTSAGPVGLPSLEFEVLRLLICFEDEHTEAGAMLNNFNRKAFKQ